MTGGKKAELVHASELKNIPWPKCGPLCSTCERLGVGECESVCPDKFPDDSPYNSRNYPKG